MIDKLLNIFYKISLFFIFPSSIKSFLTWPKFSLSSFLIINRLKQLQIKPRYIIDVGANVGQFSIAAKELFDDPLIVSIEANRNIKKEFLQNTKKYKKIEFYSSAVGDKDGFVKFYENSDSQVSSILKLGKNRKLFFPNSDVINEELIKIKKLDSLLKHRRFDNDVLLKLDVQGAEEKVISGSKNLLKKIKWIVIEISFSDLYLNEPKFDSLCAQLKILNFGFVSPLNFHFSRDKKTIIEMDALFIRK